MSVSKNIGGLKGDFNFPLARSSQSISLKKECSFSSSASRK